MPQEDVNITSRMKNDSQVRALKDKVKGLHGNMNDLEKHLKSLQVSSATKAMIQGVTVNMENHIDSLRRQFQAELNASCSDFVKYDEAYNDFQRKVDFTQLVTRMDKLIRSKVKDIFIYEAEPIFQRLWAKREKQLVGALRQNQRYSWAENILVCRPNTSVANEDVEEIEDRAIDAMSGSAASDMVGLWKIAETQTVDRATLKNLSKRAWLYQLESLRRKVGQSALRMWIARQCQVFGKR